MLSQRKLRLSQSPIKKVVWGKAPPVRIWVLALQPRARKFCWWIRSLSAYIRKMALDGYCLNLDLPQLRRMAYLLQMCSNNLNQYAKRANECGKVYAADMEDLRQRLDELIDIGKQILSKLAEL